MDKVLGENDIKGLEEEIDSAVDRLFVEKKGGPTEGFSKPPQPPAKEQPFRVEKDFDFERASPTPPSPPAPPPSAAPVFKSIEKMEGQLLSLEWEINKENLRRTKEEVHALRQTLKEKPEVGSVLNLMDKVLDYMVKNEDKIRPPLVKFLMDSTRTRRTGAYKHEEDELEDKQLDDEDELELKHELDDELLLLERHELLLLTLNTDELLELDEESSFEEPMDELDDDDEIQDDELELLLLKQDEELDDELLRQLDEDELLLDKQLLELVLLKHELELLELLLRQLDEDDEDELKQDEDELDELELLWQLLELELRQLELDQDKIDRQDDNCYCTDNWNCSCCCDITTIFTSYCSNTLDRQQRQTQQPPNPHHPTPLGLTGQV